MVKLIFVGLGGFVGALSRYFLSGWLQQASRSVHFPYGTLGVNLLGCFFIGGLATLVETKGVLSPEMRCLILIGFLGSFTTFSTFGLETMNMFRDGRMFLPFVNIVMHLAVGFTAVWAGDATVRAIWG